MFVPASLLPRRGWKVTKMRLPQRGHSLCSDAQVRVRKCLSDNDFVRTSVCHRAKVVVDVDVGYFLRRDCLPGEEICDGKAPCPSMFVRAGLLPPCG